MSISHVKSKPFKVGSSPASVLFVRSTHSCQNTSHKTPQKHAPLQHVSSKGNLQVVDIFRKHVSCFYAQGGNVGVLSLK